MDRDAITPFLEAFRAAIIAENSSRLYFTGYPPLDRDPPWPFIVLLDIGAEVSASDTIDEKSQRLAITLECWDHSGENTEALKMVGEVMSALQSTLDLTDDQFRVDEVRIEQYGVKVEPP